MVWIGVIASTFFLLYPIMGPRPDPLPETNALLDFHVRVDRPTNAFPALHVAVPAFSLLFAWHLLAATRDARGHTALAIGWLWLALVAYSTLATRQHFTADILAGLALGWLADRWGRGIGRRRVGRRD
jgi:membrane-associated phospholipid phosphatase